MSYFKEVDTFIEGNLNLRYPQRNAYSLLKKEYDLENYSHKIIVLPTGVGKTGVIGLLPFGMCDGKVLVITPGLIIREGISDEFDTRTPFNFWQKRHVINNDNNLPKVYRYAGYNTQGDMKRALRLLNESDIIIANIHKVYSESSKKTLTNLLGEDFFDMIIIDEAHHSAAESWLQTLEHFNAKKIVKLTATPFRSDNKKLEGDIIYEYELADAIKEGFVKNVVSKSFTNQKLEFLVDGRRCTKEEALDLMDRSWLTRSVAYSKECNQTIVDNSIHILTEKRRHGKAHHQIIAVACSIEHAREIKTLYEERGLSADFVASDRQRESEEVIISFKKGELDVVVNVNMLGEGFDNPNISIAAIFRPFRTLSPYAQFIGRSLRKIPNADDIIDNIAHVVYHKELDLDLLWDYYTGQKQKAERKEQIERDFEEIEHRLRDIGDVFSEGDIITETKDFLSIGIGAKYAETIKNEIDRLNLEIEETAIKMQNAGLNKEDIINFRRMKQQELDLFVTQKKDEKRNELIREELHKRHTDNLLSQTERLISEEGINPKGDELPKSTSNPFLKRADTNDAYIMMYFNSTLKTMLKRGIHEWETYDFQLAEEIIPKLVDELKNKLKG